MENISIVIIEDHPLFQQGIIDALSLEQDFTVLGYSSTGEEGLELINKLRPQVAVVDINLPGINGQQIIRRLVENRIATRVVLLTGYDEFEQKVHAFRSGAAAFCTKNIQPADLIAVLRKVARGYYAVDTRIMDDSQLQKYLEVRPSNDNRYGGDRGETVQPLSVREMEVLTCVTQGMSNKEIALYLGISQQTVKNHVTSILRKLGLVDRTQAAIFAVQQGWVRLQKPQSSREE